MLKSVTVNPYHVFFRYLLLVLMEAERAWSYAMQLKQEANTEPRKRFHLLARLRKAAKHSEKLEKLCESPRVDAKTKLEAQVHGMGSGFIPFSVPNKIPDIALIHYYFIISRDLQNA